MEEGMQGIGGCQSKGVSEMDPAFADSLVRAMMLAHWTLGVPTEDIEVAPDMEEVKLFVLSVLDDIASLV